MGLAEVQPWRLASHGFAESHDDAEFVWADAEAKSKKAARAMITAARRKMEQPGRPLPPRMTCLSLP
jgi:hypothetical protein